MAKFLKEISAGGFSFFDVADEPFNFSNHAIEIEHEISDFIKALNFKSSFEIALF